MKVKTYFYTTLFILILAAVFYGAYYMVNSNFNAQKNNISNRPILKGDAPAGVFIQTDKISYGRLENIRISVHNNLGAPIFYTTTDSFWGLEYFKNGQWIKPGYGNDGFQLTAGGLGIGDKCSTVSWEIPFPTKLDTGLIISDTWDQKVCPFENQIVKIVTEHFGASRYRLFFYYGTEISKNDPFKIIDVKKVGSREIIIVD